MDMTTMATHEVVIAGAGPTGLMLAGELALAGVDVAVVEPRLSQELAGSRAGGLHARTIEVLDQRGIAERFLSRGQAMQVAGFSFISLDLSDFPARHQGLALWQNEIERILAEWVGELPVKLRRGRAVTDFTQDESGVGIQLSDGAALRASYLVGCDGGRSVVRKRAGIEFTGWDASTSYLIAEAEMDEDPAWGLRRGPRGVNAIGKLGDGKRHDVRAPDYDDWTTATAEGFAGLNGDILVWNPVLEDAFEISSMGIRVDAQTLTRQLALCGDEDRLQLEWHQSLLKGEMPQTIGGGIGQSRLTMLLLQLSHIGQVQCGVWPAQVKESVAGLL